MSPVDQNIMRMITELTKRVADVERYVGMQKQVEPQPQSVPTLVEAVEGLLQCSGLHVPSGSVNRDTAITRTEQSLTRHKEREKLVEEAIDACDTYRDCLPARAVEAINKLRDFDKGAV